jgi:hypothetical protein
MLEKVTDGRGVSRILPVAGMEQFRKRRATVAGREVIGVGAAGGLPLIPSPGKKHKTKQEDESVYSNPV